MGSTVDILYPKGTSIRLNNSTGTALVIDEFVVLCGKSLVAREAIANGAEGALENVCGETVGALDFVTGEGNFLLGGKVFWDPTTAKFSSVETVGYYHVGYAKAARTSGQLEFIAQDALEVPTLSTVADLAGTGRTTETVKANADDIAAHIGDTSDAHDASAISVADTGELITATTVEAALAEIVGAGRTTETIKSNADAAAAIIAIAGTPFRKTGTLAAAAAGTPVNLLTAAEVLAVGAGKKAYILGFFLKVDGATAWTDSSGTVVTIQDDNGSPVVAVSLAKAQLTGNAVLFPGQTGVTLGDAITEGSGLTAEKGIDIVADSDFDAGSDIKVTVFGYIA